MSDGHEEGLWRGGTEKRCAGVVRAKVEELKIE
jgi:hypothetical protein